MKINKKFQKLDHNDKISLDDKKEGEKKARKGGRKEESQGRK